MLKSEISNLQVEKSLLESRVSGLLSTRAGEKATLSSLEKKLVDERKQKAEFQVKIFCTSDQISAKWSPDSRFVEANTKAL